MLSQADTSLIVSNIALAPGGGVFRHPRAPVSVLASERQPFNGGCASRGAAGQPSCRIQVCLLQAAAHSDRDCGSLPGLVVGAGNCVELSDEGLQLVLLQLGPEFPFQPVGHLLPGAASGFHLLEHG